ncbi:MAG: DUF134 domain-containing protein [Dehalococcoidia bacterium]|nr:DUF134 domain-containing protein [Chloroflexota bacterium]MCK4221351.1 DUF134 domain-containing protein [Dehalococcoidia bacterium]MCK4262455.1 DUF134 domain-containing protein [Dehalococcoidia bacterium]
MSRPVKLRCVAQLPSAGLFRPVGIPASALQHVRLSVEELESIRLKDLGQLDQEECARLMCISRPTFHRILEEARRKLADALINAKAVQIEGGSFGLPQSRFRCNNDGHEWDVPFESLANGVSLVCPACSSANIQPMFPPSFGFGWRRGGRFRGGRRW